MTIDVLQTICDEEKVTNALAIKALECDIPNKIDNGYYIIEERCFSSEE